MRRSAIGGPPPERNRYPRQHLRAQSVSANREANEEPSSQQSGDPQADPARAGAQPVWPP